MPLITTMIDVCTSYCVAEQQESSDSMEPPYEDANQNPIEVSQ